MKFDARKPDFRVKARKRDGTHDGIIGSAWINPSGNISVQLLPFVILNSKDDLQITSFPREKAENETAQ